VKGNRGLDRRKRLRLRLRWRSIRKASLKLKVPRIFGSVEAAYSRSRKFALTKN
jgi:hypothetical protein